MLTLYVKTGCPFCAKVLHAGEELKVSFTEKNIADSNIASELIERGGKRQVPYLIDDGNDTEMYESDAIINYLNEQYGN